MICIAIKIIWGGPSQSWADDQGETVMAPLPGSAIYEDLSRLAFKINLI